VPGFVSRVEELEVFQRAYALSLAVHRASLEFPMPMWLGAGVASTARLPGCCRACIAAVLIPDA
jgi:hypothetical protein